MNAVCELMEYEEVLSLNRLPCSSDRGFSLHLQHFPYLLHYEPPMRSKPGQHSSKLPNQLSFAQADQHRNSPSLKDPRRLQLQVLSCLCHAQLWEEHSRISPDVLITKEKDSKKTHEHAYCLPSRKCLSPCKPPLQLLWSHRL